MQHSRISQLILDFTLHLTLQRNSYSSKDSGLNRAEKNHYLQWAMLQKYLHKSFNLQNYVHANCRTISFTRDKIILATYEGYHYPHFTLCACFTLLAYTLVLLHNHETKVPFWNYIIFLFQPTNESESSITTMVRISIYTVFLPFTQVQSVCVLVYVF